MHSASYIFLDLVPLKNKNADNVFNAIIQCLKNHEITEKKLSDDLIRLACDGASMFTGKKSGVDHCLLINIQG